MSRSREVSPSAAGGAAATRRGLIGPVASFSIGAIVVTTLFAIGAWQRRWIADDGLIVLRTIRNLLAGNGPVFNAGERVEANTSTAWTYLLWFWTWVTGGQTEYVALWVALVLSVAAIPLAMYGTARLYGSHVTRGPGRGFGLLLPFGAIVYITIPPARDFATSGLENGLTIFWAATLWCLLLAWTRRGATPPERAELRADPRAKAAFLVLAFVAGLAPLVRPEAAVVGGLVLLLMFCSPVGWRMRVVMTLVAGALPVGYQIFRMGYYAVLVPNPAIAKDASGSKWDQGFAYLANLFGPYLLVLPVILAVVVGVIVGLQARADRADRADAALDPADSGATRDDLANDDHANTVPDVMNEHPAESGRAKAARRWASFSESLQTPRAAVATILAAGAILFVYWLRQGGDFMHGRVLLTPIFILLLPVMVVPAVLPDSVRTRAGRLRLASAVGVFAAWIGTAWWGVAVNQTVLPNAGMEIGRSGIVDERRFYVTNMAIENPVTAKDYLDYPRMRAMVEKIDEVRATGGIILPSANFDEWYVAKLPDKMAPGKPRQVSVYFLNLGMTSMNAPLDVRVIDPMGLAYPLAAHTARLEDGRIGHDKSLPSAWVVAESGGVSGGRGLPAFIDKDDLKMARVALTCPQTQERFRSYKDVWSFERFRHNLRQSPTLNGYRIVREPKYEIARCGLEMPAGLSDK